MAVPLPILGGAYTDETRPLSSQDTCNYILFPAEKAGTRTEGQLIDAPGLVPFAGVGDGPHRGARDVEGKLFVVSGNKLYQVAPTGVATEIGTIPGTDRVSITHNQIENGNQVLIGTRDNSYVYNTVTGVLAATGVPLFSVDFINQLFVGVDQGRRFWRYSALVDGTDWNSLDNEGAESSPDRIVGLIVSQGEVLVFGERTIEVWANSPNSSTAFQRVQVIERGCASPETICRLDNSVIFLGNDNILYRLEGYSPRPISTHVLTREWGNREPRKAFAFTYEDKGRVIYYLTHKDGQTFGYDVTTGEFHRRESYGFNRWRLNTLVKWNKQWYGGDFADGTLWRLDWRYMKEGCDEMVRYRRTGVLSDNQRRVTVNSVELLLDTGREIEVEEFGPPEISGSAPATFTTGDTVDFQYTLTLAYPGQAVELIVTGLLPEGLTLSNTGHLTGQVEVGGEYDWTITPQDACGSGSPLDDDTVVTDPVPPPWLAIPSHGVGNDDLKPAPDGLDWTSGASYNSAGITQDGFPRLYYGDNGTVLYTNCNSATIKVSISADLSTFSAVGSAPSMASDGARAIYASGYWHICVGSVGGAAEIRRLSDALAWDVVGTAPALRSIARGQNNICGITHSNSGRAWTAPLDGSVWTQRSIIAGGNASENWFALAGSPSGEFGYLILKDTGSGATHGTPTLWRSTDDGVTFASATNPLPVVITASGSQQRCRIRYDATLGLWLLTAGDRIAYGPDLGNLTLAAHVAPGRIEDIGSDGLKFVICGAFGFESTVDGINYTTLSTNLISGAQALTALGVAA